MPRLCELRDLLTAFIWTQPQEQHRNPASAIPKNVLGGRSRNCALPSPSLKKIAQGEPRMAILLPLAGIVGLRDGGIFPCHWAMLG